MFYNNLLSLPCCLLLMTATGELHKVWLEPDLHNKTFLLVAALSGLIGFAIRFAGALSTSAWCGLVSRGQGLRTRERWPVPLLPAASRRCGS